jgi:MFS family permease
MRERRPGMPSGRRSRRGAMNALAQSVAEYREAARQFSRPARLFLLSTSLTWMAHGVSSVLFNLYLTTGGFRESFVGRVISLNALGVVLVALPAGVLADRWGRRRCLVLGTVLEGAALAARASVLHPGVIAGASFVVGMGQALCAIAAAPYITEHSSARERTHLFSAFFSLELLAGVLGSMLGGWAPPLLLRLPAVAAPGLLVAYRITLLLGAAIALLAALPLTMLAGVREAVITHSREATGKATRKLIPLAVNAFLIGAGAGLVIPFMNLYFAVRFHCSSAQIGVFFSIAAVSTAVATALGPALARRFGKLRTATAMELLSLPFLVTLGAERHLATAVGAFWLRATLMQAGTPLINAFVMESLPPALRARASSLNNTVWNGGWAVSATLSGLIIQRFGYAVPFYITAVLYATAALTFYFSFRRQPEVHAEGLVPAEVPARTETPIVE